MISIPSKFKPFLLYSSYSLFVTIIDISIVWLLLRVFSVNIVLANTTGVVTGAILHYILSSKKVFNFDYGFIGIAIYFITFLIGLVLADILIYISHCYLFTSFNDDLNFLFSKGISIAAPFFVLYYLRKKLYSLAKIRRKG